MDQVISGVVDHTIVPMANLIAWMASNGVLLLIFAGLWAAFGIALVFSQGSIDQAWLWIRSLPILIEAIVWLLFLPVVGGLWVWETTWPLLLRLIVVLGLGFWNILVFLPSATPAR